MTSSRGGQRGGEALDLRLGSGSAGIGRGRRGPRLRDGGGLSLRGRGRFRCRRCCRCRCRCCRLLLLRNRGQGLDSFGQPPPQLPRLSRRGLSHGGKLRIKSRGPPPRLGRVRRRGGSDARVGGQIAQVGAELPYFGAQGGAQRGEVAGGRCGGGSVERRRRSGCRGDGGVEGGGRGGRRPATPSDGEALQLALELGVEGVKLLCV